MADELMSVREVARACGRSEETVRRWIWSGKLSAAKLGNQLFVKRGDVEAMRAPKTAEAKASYGTRRTQHTSNEPALEFTAVKYDREVELAKLERIIRRNEAWERKPSKYDITTDLQRIRGEEEYD